jgi:MFS family permease
MLPLVLSAVSVFMAAALFTAGQMLLGTQLSLGLSAAGFAPIHIGLIMMCYSFGFMLGSVTGPRLISRVGHIRVFSAFAAITCCAALMHSVYLHDLLWALLRAISGFCGALLLIVLESWINAHATPQARGRLMSLYMVNYYIAGAGGQLLIGLYPPGDHRLFAIAACLLVLASVPLSLTSRPAPALPASSRMAFRELFEASRISIAGALAAGFAMSAFYQLSPVSVKGLGYDVGTVAHYMACAVLASMTLQYPLGRLSDRYDRRRVILGIGVAVAAASLLVATIGQLSLAALFGASMLFTATLSCLYPASLARLNDRTHGRHPVAANASLLLCYGVGQCVGPIVSAAVMSLLGPAGLYVSVFVVMLAFAGYSLRRLETANTAVDDQQRYVPMPSLSTAGIVNAEPPSDNRP